MNIHSKINNYAYQLNTKQVDNVKEEIVEGKTAEVQAEVPKVEVITENANNILGDINKAMLMGVNVKKVEKAKDYPPELEAYFSLKTYWEQNNSQMTSTEQMRELSELISAINQCLHSNNTMPNGTEIVLRNDLIYWHQLSNRLNIPHYPAPTPEYVIDNLAIINYGIATNQHFAFSDAFESIKEVDIPTCINFFRDKVTTLENLINSINFAINFLNNNYPNAGMASNNQTIVEVLQEKLLIIQQQLEDARRFLEQAQLLSQQAVAQVNNGPADE